MVQIPAWSKICLSSFEIFFFFIFILFDVFRVKTMFGVFGKDWNQWLRKKFMGKRKKTNNSFRSKIQFIIVFYYYPMWNTDTVSESRGINLYSKTKQSLFNPFVPPSSDLFLPFFTLFSPLPLYPPLSSLPDCQPWRRCATFQPRGSQASLLRLSLSD